MCAVDAFRSMLGGLIESGMENPLERQAKFDEHMGQVQENIRVTYVLGPSLLVILASRSSFSLCLACLLPQPQLAPYSKVRTSFNPRQDWNGTKWVSRTRCKLHFRVSHRQPTSVHTVEEMNGRHLSDSAAILSQMENDYGKNEWATSLRPALRSPRARPSPRFVCSVLTRPLSSCNCCAGSEKPFKDYKPQPAEDV